MDSITVWFWDLNIVDIKLATFWWNILQLGLITHSLSTCWNNLQVDKIYYTYMGNWLIMRVLELLIL
jgi:hypothetical protein